MKKTLIFAAVASVSLLSAACTSKDGPMDAGERMSQRGGDIGAYGAA